MSLTGLYDTWLYFPILFLYNPNEQLKTIIKKYHLHTSMWKHKQNMYKILIFKIIKHWEKLKTTWINGKRYCGYRSGDTISLNCYSTPDWSINST